MLAKQIADVATQLAAKTGITVGTVLGGVYYDTVICDQVIVASPGKCADLLKTRRQLNPHDFKLLVLDEADDLVENFELDTRKIRGCLPADVQVLLFSASFNAMERVAPREFADFLLAGRGEHVAVRVTGGESFATDLRRFYAECADGDKFGVLLDIFYAATVGRSIIFANTKARCADLARRMATAGFAVGVMTSDQKEADQERVLDEFKAGTTKVLIASGMVERGVDITGVSMVVNYDMPRNESGFNITSYQHRCGRAARFGAPGVVIDFVCDAASRSALSDVRVHFKAELTLLDDCGMVELKNRLEGCTLAFPHEKPAAPMLLGPRGSADDLERSDATVCTHGEVGASLDSAGYVGTVAASLPRGYDGRTGGFGGPAATAPASFVPPFDASGGAGFGGGGGGMESARSLLGGASHALGSGSACGGYVQHMSAVAAAGGGRAAGSVGDRKMHVGSVSLDRVHSPRTSTSTSREIAAAVSIIFRPSAHGGSGGDRVEYRDVVSSYGGGGYGGRVSSSSGSGRVHVKAYTRKDGTYVAAHTRARPTRR